ncbi:MAG: signal recognition particle protein [Halofilum sp. (in: g-proteobacteria)]|nr:signal recognition particle protein [Halofilum sp. (in: g-proteobacteria)]
MFDSLTERLGRTLKDLRGRGRLTEDNIRDSLREIRMALLEADVALPVVKQFIERARERALGQEVVGSVSPGQALVKVVNDELIAVMGGESAELNLRTQPPAVVLVAGLQGAGKTTTIAKLARRLSERDRKRVAVASADIHRPAARDQLATLAEQVGVTYLPVEGAESAVDIARGARDAARKAGHDVLLVDSAGRLAIDETMMDEIRAVHGEIEPVETLFVVDSLSGQDAARTAQAFDEALPLTGVVLTKTDGDARGGAALSVRMVTGKPIKFIGSGEKTDALEVFHPDRIASRILGMGDVVSLVEEAQQQVDTDKAEKLARKLKKGKGFDLGDMRDQLDQMQKMGGLGSMMEKMGGVSQAQMQQASGAFGDTKHMIAIIDSMTLQERRWPATINGSRKRRMAAGSGTRVQDVNRLLKQHAQMAKMMKKMSKKGGMQKMMRGMGGQGGMPPGMGF